MKKLIFFLMFFYSFLTYGQENLLKTYRIKAKTSKGRILKVIDTTYYKDLTLKEKIDYKEDFTKKYKDSTFTYTEEFIINGKKVSIEKTESLYINNELNDSIFNKDIIDIKPIEIKKIKISRRSNKKGFQGHIKLNEEENKILVTLDKCQNKSNIFRESKFDKLKNLIKCDTILLYIKNKDKNILYKKNKELLFYYDLPHQKTLRISYKEWSVSTLVIPIKYRFKQSGLEEDFTTAVNINFFIGGSWGKTSFYNNGLKTKTNNWKLSGGFISGTGVLELNEGNIIKEKLTEEEIKFYNDGGTINKGLVSLGFGITYSFNSINIGAFSGWDYAIGESSDLWKYGKKPWLGLAVGYDLFKL